jgi:hypothetical protein
VSKEYKKGYRDGFKDGMEAAKQISAPYILPTTSPFPPSMITTCDTCGIEMKGAWGYVCNHPKCPTKVTC